MYSIENGVFVIQNNNRLFDFELKEDEIINSIFSKYDNLTINDIVPIATGMSTSNYKVKANEKSFLLKIYPKNNDHSEMEIAAYRYAAKITRVPKIYLYDNSKAIVDNSYAIFQYIDGLTLREYILKHRCFPIEIAYEIGNMLALIHKKEFQYTSLLNADLSIEKQILPFENQFNYFLNEFAGKHINKELKQKLLYFIEKNSKLIEQISSINVLCHGDFNPSNILIDNDSIPYFIDFEYCFAVPRYYDMGKLFRSRDNYSQYIKEKELNAFSRGYNLGCVVSMPDNWYELSKVADIVSMLAFINKEKVPKDWIDGIEDEINSTINLIKENEMIKTNRLILKPYNDTDQNRMIELLTNDKIKETFMIPDFKSMEEAISMFKKIKNNSYSDSHYELGIYLEDNLIGFVNDVGIEDEVIELGYVIDPEFYNNGYATEALIAVIDDLFKKGFKEVCAGAFESHISSFKVMQKSGMSKIDKEEDITYRGKTHHCYYYSIKQK